MTIRWGNGSTTTLLLEVFTQRNFVADSVQLKLNFIVLQQEAYPAIWRPVDAQNSAIPGDIPQNRKRPVQHQAKLPCKISR